MSTTSVVPPAVSSKLERVAVALRAAAAAESGFEFRLATLDALALYQEALGEGSGVDAATATADPAFEAYFTRAEQYVRCLAALADPTDA